MGDLWARRSGDDIRRWKSGVGLRVVEMASALVMLNMMIVMIQRGESGAVHGGYRKVVWSSFGRWLVWRFIVMSWWAVGYRVLMVRLDDDRAYVLVLV